MATERLFHGTNTRGGRRMVVHTTLDCPHRPGEYEVLAAVPPGLRLCAFCGAVPSGD